MPGPFTGVGGQGNLPYDLFQSEVGKLRHKKGHGGTGPAQPDRRPMSFLCSGLLSRGEQSSPKKSRLSLSQDEGVASHDISFSPEYRQEDTRVLLSPKPRKPNFRY